jgi:hypothetical protein
VLLKYTAHVGVGIPAGHIVLTCEIRYFSLGELNNVLKLCGLHVMLLRTCDLGIAPFAG